jgi:polyisoprenoid-binding protein YceI
MKKLLIIGTGLLIITFAYAATTWKIVNKDVEISFILPSQGTTGSISGLNANIQFDEKNMEASSISATVDVSKMETDNKQKTEHLLSADFFNAEKYPQMKFTSTGFTKNDSSLVAIGKLTIKDSIKEVRLPFTFTKTKEGGVFQGTMSIFSGDFGIGKKSSSGKDRVVVSIKVPVVE